MIRRVIGAAAVLLAVYLVVPPRTEVQQVQVEVASNWGWTKPGAFPENIDRAAYLNRLADLPDLLVRLD